MRKFFLGDCVEGLGGIRAASLDLTVTSPPYGKLRTYGGHPFTRDVFRKVADQLWRTTKPGGVVCWQEGVWMETPGCHSIDPYRHAVYFRERGFNFYEVLFNSCPGGRNIRRHYTKGVQQVFVWSKGRPTTVNLLLKKNRHQGGACGYVERRPDGTKKYREWRDIQEMGVRTVTWRYKTAHHTERPYGDVAHGGLMHQCLARDLIRSYSREGDLVCDPFGGLATTAKWAIITGRDYLSWEIHQPYHEWGLKRIDAAERTRLRFLLRSST